MLPREECPRNEPHESLDEKRPTAGTLGRNTELLESSHWRL